jgi:hypothetical protein
LNARIAAAVPSIAARIPASQCVCSISAERPANDPNWAFDQPMAAATTAPMAPSARQNVAVGLGCAVRLRSRRSSIRAETRIKAMGKCTDSGCSLPKNCHSITNPNHPATAFIFFGDLATNLSHYSKAAPDPNWQD